MLQPSKIAPSTSHCCEEMSKAPKFSRTPGIEAKTLKEI